MHNVLSCFDGISSLQHILRDRLKISKIKYYSSEVNKSSIKITQHNYPKTFQLGDIRKISRKDLPNDMLLISAGSPCQDLSIAGKKRGMSTVDNIEITSLRDYMRHKKKGTEFVGQSYLFWEFIRLVKEVKPKYFFLENVRMHEKWKDVISKELGVQPVQINSKLITAQNRDRLYWTNIPYGPIKKKEFKLGDVIPNAIAGAGYRTRPGYKEKYLTIRKDHKANCLTRSKNIRMIKFRNGSIRNMTVSEAEIVQTLPVGYTNAPKVCLTDRFDAIGNGWSIDTVLHLIKPLKKLI